MASAETRELLAQIGVNQMPTSKALEILEYVLGANYIRVTAADIDWSLFKAVNEVRGEQPFFERIKSKAAGATGDGLGHAALLIIGIARANATTTSAPQSARRTRFRRRLSSMA